jgi:hypothetical protein
MWLACRHAERHMTLMRTERHRRSQESDNNQKRDGEATPDSDLKETGGPTQDGGSAFPKRRYGTCVVLGA